MLRALRGSRFAVSPRLRPSASLSRFSQKRDEFEVLSELLCGGVEVPAVDPAILATTRDVQRAVHGVTLVTDRSPEGCYFGGHFEILSLCSFRWGLSAIRN
jgi:hypothetical protein